MLMNDLISIIIPFYSQKQWLKEALDSLLNQEYKSIEVILINDGSNEEIDDLIYFYSGKITLHYLVQENAGPAVARNLGIEKAKGKYICFLDADDLWKPQKLQKQLKFHHLQDFQWSITNYQLFLDESKEKLPIKHHLEGGDVFNRSLFSCAIATPTVMIETEMLRNNKQLRFIEETRYGEDTLFWFNLLSLYPVGYLDEILTQVRIRQNNAAKMVNIQLSARAYIYQYFRNRKFVLNKRNIPNSARLIYHLSFLFNKCNPNKNEAIAKVLYLPIWLLFKIFYKINK